MNSTEIILYDSPEAASIQTPKPGWVSRRGMWLGDDEFNKAIKGREPLSWEPGKYALKTEAANG